MKILLVCAGGMSTGMLMRKMEKYWEEQRRELVVRATGLAEYKNVAKDYDIIMVGPQVSYRLNEIKETTGLPTAVISSADYALGNGPNIMSLAEELYIEVK